MADRGDDTGSVYNGRSLPSWVRGIAFLIGTVGFPAVVAGYLLLQTGGIIASPLTEMRASLAAHVSHDDQVLRLLRAICRNTARTTREADTCDPPQRGDTR